MSDTGFRPAHGEADWYDERLPRAIRSHRGNPFRTLATVTLVVVLASLLGINFAIGNIGRQSE